MSDVEVLPELKQIIGALLFGAKTPLTVAEIRRVLAQVAEQWGGKTRDFGKATEKDVRSAMEQLRAELETVKVGIHLSEVANGFRLENDVSCGPWLRHLLSRGRGNRLTRPALETLAIIAYRQPCMRSEIEVVRGVQVDQIIRNLLEMQLVRIVGRSELPGRPWQFGTTQKFLEHFGIKSLQDLPGIEELRRMEEEQSRRDREAVAANEADAAVQAAAAQDGQDDAVQEESGKGEAKGDEPVAAKDDDQVDLADLEEEYDDEEEDEDDEDDDEDEEDSDRDG